MLPVFFFLQRAIQSGKASVFPFPLSPLIDVLLLSMTCPFQNHPPPPQEFLCTLLPRYKEYKEYVTNSSIEKTFLKPAPKDLQMC